MTTPAKSDHSNPHHPQSITMMATPPTWPLRRGRVAKRRRRWKIMVAGDRSGTPTPNCSGSLTSVQTQPKLYSYLTQSISHPISLSHFLTFIPDNQEYSYLLGCLEYTQGTFWESSSFEKGKVFFFRSNIKSCTSLMLSSCVLNLGHIWRRRSYNLFPSELKY